MGRGEKVGPEGEDINDDDDDGGDDDEEEGDFTNRLERPLCCCCSSQPHIIALSVLNCSSGAGPDNNNTKPTKYNNENAITAEE